MERQRKLSEQESRPTTATPEPASDATEHSSSFGSQHRPLLASEYDELTTSPSGTAATSQVVSPIPRTEISEDPALPVSEHISGEPSVVSEVAEPGPSRGPSQASKQSFGFSSESIASVSSVDLSSRSLVSGLQAPHGTGASVSALGFTKNDLNVDTILPSTSRGPTSANKEARAVSFSPPPPLSLNSQVEPSSAASSAEPPMSENHRRYMEYLESIEHLASRDFDSLDIYYDIPSCEICKDHVGAHWWKRVRTRRFLRKQFPNHRQSLTDSELKSFYVHGAEKIRISDPPECMCHIRGDVPFEDIHSSDESPPCSPLPENRFFTEKAYLVGTLVPKGWRERDRREKERKKQEAKEQKEREKKEAKERKERETQEAKERKEREAQEAKERKEREAQEAKERKEREAQEAKEQKEREKREKKQQKEKKDKRQRP